MIVVIGGHALLRQSGWAGLTIGGALIALGLYQLAARRSLFAGAVNLRVSPRATAIGVLAFGVAYAAASLGCTIPIFLTVVSGVFAGPGGIALAAADFIQYAVGMGLVLTLITVSIAFFRRQTTQLVSGVLPYVNVAGNVLLMFAGAYLVWYWTVLGQIV
jgi:cytochrome c biogenesis protein CcdA